MIDRVKELLGLKPALDGDGTRLVTPPIKVIRPPDRTQAAPDSRSSDAASSPETASIASFDEVAGHEASTEPLTADTVRSEPEPSPGCEPFAVLTNTDPDPGDAQPSEVFESLLTAELDRAGDGLGRQKASAGHDPSGAELGTAEGFHPAAGVTRETWDDLAARLEARLGLPDVRNELQHSMIIAVNDAVARALRESVASEVASVLSDLQPALEQAVRESISSALPVAVAHATDGLRQEIQSHVASAVAAAMPAAMAEAAAGALGESVRAIVLETSERLVKNEIARIRGQAVPGG